MPEELRFLAELLLSSLPNWLFDYALEHELVIHNLNCATGDANAVLRSAFPRNQIIGLDSNQDDLNIASRCYPDLQFEHFDYLSGAELETNLLCCLNQDSLLSDPIAVVESLSPFNSHFICLLAPLFEEGKRESSALHLTWPEIPVRLGNDFKLIHVMPRYATHWPGNQVCLVYAKSKVLKELIEEGLLGPHEWGFIELYNPEADKSSVLKKMLDLAELRATKAHQLQEDSQDDGDRFSVAPQDAPIAQTHSTKTTYRRKKRQLEQALEKAKHHHDRLVQALGKLGEQASERQDEELPVELDQPLGRNPIPNKQLIEHETTIEHLRYLSRRKDYRILQLKGWLTLLVKHPILSKLLSLRRALGGSGYVGPESVIDKAEDPEPESMAQQRIDAGSIPLAETGKVYPEILRRYSFDSFRSVLAERLAKAKGLFIQSTCVNWSIPLYQRPQHMAHAMIRAGYVVLYLTDNHLFDDIHGFEELEHNLFLTNQNDVIYQVSNAIISFYSTSAAYSIADIAAIRKNNNTVVYEYIDHIDPLISSDNVGKLMNLYRAVNADTIDLVACGSRQLESNIITRFPEQRICYLPNGVDTKHYDSAARSKDNIPPRLQTVVARNKPIVGYFGAIAPWLWFSMLNELTSQRQDLEFVFVGDDYLGATAHLASLPNVCLTGVIPYKDLPGAAAYFDAAIIPFAPGRIAQATSPLKLYEYLALRKPVVVTWDMHECTALEKVLSADSTAAFSAKIDEALKVGRQKAYQRWAASTAQENDWDERASELLRFVNDYHGTGQSHG